VKNVLEKKFSKLHDSIFSKFKITDQYGQLKTK